MNTLTKGLIGTATAGAMAFAATPAMAGDNHDRGIGAGEIIAGALIIGGIAAIASRGSDRYDDRYYRDGRYYGGDRDYRDGRYDDRYDRRYRISSREAVERCVRAAERDARRYGYRRVDVTDIRDVDRSGSGYKVKGRIAVDTGYRGGRYGRGWDNDYRGYRNEHRGYDSGKFTCKVDGRGVRDVEFSGIRRLR